MSGDKGRCGWSRRTLRLSVVLVGLAVTACSEDVQLPEEQTVARLSIEPAQASIRELATVQFRASAIDERGREFPHPVAWVSLSTDNATIDNTGLATGVRGGYAEINAEAGGQVAKALLYVEEYPATIEFPESTVLLDPARSVQLQPTVRCRNGHDVASLIEWKSDPTSIAVVDETGLVSGVDPGMATITAKAGQAVQTLTVVVRDPVLDVLVQPQWMRLRVHQTVRLEAKVRTRLGWSTRQAASWTSGDPAIASIASDGTVEGMSVGSTTISAETEGSIGRALVIVEEPIVSIRVIPSSARMTVGGSLQLAAEAVNRRGEQVAPPLDWASHDPVIATVDAAGLVSAIQPGTVRIDAAAEGLVGSAPILVEPKAATLKISPASANIAVGASLALAARAEDATGAPVSPPILWSSSDPEIADVNSEGIVFGRASGRVVIFAEADGIIATADITVNATVASVSLTPATLTLDPGQAVQLAAVIKDRLGNSLSASLLWASSDQTVAEVTSGGLVTGVRSGTATITAMAGSVVGNATVNVTSGHGAGGVDHILVTPDSADLAVGATLQLSAVAHDGNDEPVAVSFLWSSDDSSVAVVDASGLVTGKADGHVVITAEADGIKGAAIINVGQGGGGGGGGGGGEEGLGNNLSWPVVFSEGYGVTGQPVTVDPGVRPTADEGIVVTGRSAFFYPGNEPDYMGSIFTQQSENTWRAEWHDGSGATQDVQVDWGDNIVGHTWNTHSVIRIEVTLYAKSVAELTGFNMFYLYGQGPTEMQGTDGTTGPFQPTVFTITPRLTIEKLDTLKNPIPGTVIFDGSVADGLGGEGPGSYGAEVNVAGKVVYGYNLFIRDAVLPANIHKYGWWRITFSLQPLVTVGGVAVARNTKLVDLADVSGLYVPVLDAAGTSSTIEIWVDSASGGGGGGGGGHTSSSTSAVVRAPVRR